MRELNIMLVGLFGLGCAAGCRTATRVTEVPRVDLELGGGNRGYLVGTPPESANVKTTRQMVQTDIEIPSFYKPKHIGIPAIFEKMTSSPHGEPKAPDAAASGASPAGPHDTYVVQRGDSLWSIAARPEIYGKATMWRRIFDANRDVLKGPDRVRPGMRLKIPRGKDAGGATYSDEGVTYKK